MGNIDAINHCEKHFCQWIQIRLHENGIDADYQQGLSELLRRHERELDSVEQHIKPLKRWCKIKDECYEMTSDSGSVATMNKPKINELMEKIAFEGQILLLTMQG